MSDPFDNDDIRAQISTRKLQKRLDEVLQYRHREDRIIKSLDSKPHVSRTADRSSSTRAWEELTMVHPSITAVGSTMHTVVEIDARDTLQELRQAYHALSETLAEEREKKRRAATTTTTQREMHGYAGAVGGGDESDVYDHVGDYGDEEEEYTVLEEVGYRAETLLESLPFLSALSVATTTAEPYSATSSLFFNSFSQIRTDVPKMFNCLSVGVRKSLHGMRPGTMATVRATFSPYAHSQFSDLTFGGSLQTRLNRNSIGGVSLDVPVHPIFAPFELYKRTQLFVNTRLRENLFSFATLGYNPAAGDTMLEAQVDHYMTRDTRNVCSFKTQLPVGSMLWTGQLPHVDRLASAEWRHHINRNTSVVLASSVDVDPMNRPSEAIAFGLSGVVARRVTDRTEIGLGLGVHMQHGVNIHLTFSRQQTHLSVPIRLTDRPTLKSVALAAIAPVVLYFSAKWIIQAAKTQWDRRNLIAHRRDVVHKTSQERNAALEELDQMRERITLNREYETESNGLVILNARFGNLHDTSLYEGISRNLHPWLDVKDQIQYYVNDSKLFLPRYPFSKLLGIYDPCPDERKQLWIEYSFRGEHGSVTIDDENECHLPPS